MHGAIELFLILILTILFGAGTAAAPADPPQHQPDHEPTSQHSHPSDEQTDGEFSCDGMFSDHQEKHLSVE